MALVKAGALWKKEKNGNVYLSGEVDLAGQKHRVMVYKNDKKESAKHPDYRVMLVKDDEERPDPLPASQADYGTQVPDDDIPF